MRNLKNTLILICSLLSINIYAQNDLEIANKNYELHLYQEAANTYEKVLSTQKTDLTTMGNLADCYWHLNDLQRAEKWYNELLRNTGIDKAYYFKYGLVLKGQQKYQGAKSAFKKYALKNPDVGTHYAKSCDEAIRLANSAAAYKVSKEFMNTPHADFGATFFKNKKVAFSSARAKPDGKQGTKYNQLYMSGFDGNKRLTVPEKLHTTMMEGYNEGSICYSPDGKTVFFTKNNYTNGSRIVLSEGVKLDLYIATVNKKGDWVEAKPFPFNGFNYSTGFPAMSKDGKRLYFSSNRPNGNGGFDIYVSHKTADSWAEPINVGDEVNTQGDEISPYIIADKLYFSSDWHTGLGGQDIFSADMKGDIGRGVQNLGSSINSSYDDFCFVYDISANKGYITSNRAVEGNEDIYQVVKTGKVQTPVLANTKPSISNKPVTDYDVVSVKPTAETTSYKGMIVDARSRQKLDNVIVTLLNKTQGTKQEAKTDKKGRYSFSLSKNSEYLIKFSKESYIEIARTIRTKDKVPTNILGEVALKLSPTSLLADKPSAPVEEDPLTASFAEREIDAYEVQIGSYMNPEVKKLAKLSKYGQVYSEYKDGKHLYKIGVFAELAIAQQVETALKKEGYKDAFVRTTSVKVSTPETSAPAPTMTTTAPAPKPKPVVVSRTVNPAAVSYVIQVGAFKNPNTFDTSKLQDLGNVEHYFRSKDGLTLILLTGFDSHKAAKNARRIAATRGYADAYVVAEKNGEIVSVYEARRK